MDDENDSDEYKKLRGEFVDKVFRFHEKRGTPLKRLPMLGGRELNIYHLYEEVQKRGGSVKVTKVRMWGEIARTFNLPSTVTSASYAIRNHFIKLLEDFEAAENGLDPGPVMHKPPPTLSFPHVPILPSLPKPLPLFKKPSIPTTFSLTFSSPLETKTSETDVGMSKLTCSLLSGLPNEVDFAFNILLILSHSTQLAIHKIPSVLDIMLAQVAIFSEDDPGLESMYKEEWNRDNELDFHTFWEMTTPEWIFSTILNAPIKKSLYQYLLFNRETLFLHGEGRGERDRGSCEEEGVEVMRASQVATILSNLSNNDSSVKILAEHPGILRFLVLGMSCDLPSVRIPSLDCLSNLASSMMLNYDTEDFESPVYVLVASLHQCILSEDRFAVKRGIEILGKLSWNHANTSIILSTPAAVYHCLLHSLLLPDCEMIIIALDSLYSLSLFAREIAEHISSVRGLITALVKLLSFRIESLPSDSLARIKLYFVGDSASLAQYLTDIQTKSKAPPMMSSTSVTPPTVVGGGAYSTGGAKGVVASPLVTNQIHSKPIVLTRAISPLMTNQIASKGHVMMSSGKSQNNTISGLHSILSGQSQTGSKNTPKEEFAIEWLKQSYEVQTTQHLVLLVDMYAQYVLYCSSKGKRDFLNNAEFMKILRQVFPGSQTREVQTVAKKVIHFITGLRRIPQTLKNHTPSPMVTMTTSSTLSTNQVTKISATITRVTNTTGPQSSPGSPQMTSSGYQSPSVSVQPFTASPISSNTATPSPSLSLSHSPTNSLTSSTVSSCDSTPSIRISPDSELIDTQNSTKANQTDHTRTTVDQTDHARTTIDQTDQIPTKIDQTDHTRTTVDKNRTTIPPSTMSLTDTHDITRNDMTSPKPHPHYIIPSPPTTTNSSSFSPSDQQSNSVELASIASTVSIIDRDKQTQSVTTTSQAVSTVDREHPMATMPNERGYNFNNLGVKYFDESQQNFDLKIKNLNHLTNSDSDISKGSNPGFHNATPKRPLISGRSLKGGVVLNDIHDLKNWADSKGDNALYEGLTSKNDGHFEGVEEMKNDRSISAEPVLVASAVSLIDQNRQTRSVTPDSVPEAKRIKLSSPIHNSNKQQQTTTTLTQQKQQQSLKINVEPQQTRQTSYTTSTVRFVNNKSPSNSSDSSNVSKTSSNSSAVRPVCLWENCMSMRYSWRDLLHHVVTFHLSSLSANISSSCHWTGCTATPLRKPSSLIHHVETYHCSPGPSPIPPSATATLARLRHCPPLEVEVESPLTKAVRVTAALVLRNLCRMAPSTHTLLRSHEYRLSQVALSNGEASNTIAECLNFLTLPSSHPPSHSSSHSEHCTLTQSPPQTD